MSADPNQPPRDVGDDLREEALDERLPTSEPAAVDSTVGTGSFFAVGCAILAILIIFVGIAIFFLR